MSDINYIPELRENEEGTDYHYRWGYQQALRDVLDKIKDELEIINDDIMDTKSYGFGLYPWDLKRREILEKVYCRIKEDIEEE